MKRKWLSMIMLAVMVLSLAACQKSEENKDDTVKNQETNTDNNTEDTEGAGNAGTEDTSLQYISDNGKFIMGLDDSFAPMGFRDDNNEIVGFDVDLAKAVCEKLGVELVLQPIDWEAKEQELNTKNIDCIWNGFSVTPDRKENLTLSDSYMTNNISLVVMKDGAITSMADMDGKNLALQSGSAADETLNTEENADFKASLAEVNSFDSYNTALLDLETGNSDAVLMDSVMAEYMIKDLGKDYVVLDETLLADAYAIGFRKGEEALCEAVDNALKELKAEGTVTQISEKWFGEDITTIE